MLISGAIQLNVCLQNKLNTYLLRLKKKRAYKRMNFANNNSVTKEEYVSDRKKTQRPVERRNGF